MGAGVFFCHILEVILFNQFLEQSQVFRHIPAVLEARIPGMGIRQFLPVLGARIIPTFAAKRQAFFLIAADTQFAAPFAFPFLQASHLLRGAAQVSFTKRRAGPAVNSTGS